MAGRVAPPVGAGSIIVNGTTYHFDLRQSTEDTNELLAEIAVIAFEDRPDKSNKITESLEKTLDNYIKKYSTEDGEPIFIVQSPQDPSQFDMSPLSLACKTKNTDLIDLIVDVFHANFEDILNISDRAGNNIFHMLFFYDTDLDTLNYLIELLKINYKCQMIKLLYSKNTLGYSPLDILADGLLINPNGIGMQAAVEIREHSHVNHYTESAEMKFVGGELGHKSKIAKGLNDIRKWQRRTALVQRLMGISSISAPGSLFSKIKNTITIPQILEMIINK